MTPSPRALDLILSEVPMDGPAIAEVARIMVPHVIGMAPEATGRKGV